jgi:hypothetical protein
MGTHMLRTKKFLPHGKQKKESVHPTQQSEIQLFVLLENGRVFPLISKRDMDRPCKLHGHE